ncbi:MAG: hypothetical protein V3W08_09070, partial [Candidatus Binatia bacterium]
MKRRNGEDGPRAKLENIELDLSAYKVLLHFQDHEDPLVIHFDTPARRFYFSLIALVISEMKNLGKPGFIHIRKHEKTLRLLDNALAGQHASKTAHGMWEKIRTAWHYRLPDLEQAVQFKVLERDLIAPQEKGGKYRYECSDEECDAWASLFNYDENNKWRFKFAVDSASLSLDDIWLTLGDLRDISAWQGFLNNLSAVEQLAGEKEVRERTKPKRWHREAVAAVAILLVLAAGVAIRNLYFRPVPPPAELELPDKPSIAVLPFDNMSDDPKQEYFSDGITDDLITDLSKVSGLFVIARHSMFTYKGKPVKVKQVAEELGVRYVLEGSVRRAGEQVRINAQLIDTTTGGHLWAERYEGQMDNVFALQDRITKKIVSALTVQLTAGDEKQVARKETDSAEAYDAFLQGLAHYWRDTPEDLVQAVPYLEKAVELDPKYSRAYAALAAVYQRAVTRQGWYSSLGLSYSEAREKAKQYLQEAMKDPTVLAHLVASDMHRVEGRYQEAITEATRAIALDSNDSVGYRAMARVLIYAGSPAEGADFIKKAMRLDPRYPPSYLLYLGFAQFGMERFEEAAASMEQATKRNPDDEWGFLLLAATYGQLGREQEAKSAMETFNDLRAKAGWSTYTLQYLDVWEFKEQTDRERLREGLRKAGVPPGPDPVADADNLISPKKAGL